MGENLYNFPHPLMINSGKFWRCRHGHTSLGTPCWRCGLFHPFHYLKDWWGSKA